MLIFTRFGIALQTFYANMLGCHTVYLPLYQQKKKTLRDIYIDAWSLHAHCVRMKNISGGCPSLQGNWSNARAITPKLVTGE